LTRHELKEQVQHDVFADSVARVVDYTTTHRSQVIKWSSIAVVAAAIVAGVLWYLSYARGQRQTDLEAAFQVLSAPVGQNTPGVKSYPTEDAKRNASVKALTEVINKDGGSREGRIAQYYRGTLNVQKDPKSAESDLKAVANDSGDIGSLAKIALAQVYSGSNRVPEAQGLLRDIINHPTSLVSKAQAQIMLAQLDQSANPQEAKNILQDLKNNPDPVVARSAEQLLGQIGH
jgi:hypothetical protein